MTINLIDLTIGYGQAEILKDLSLEIKSEVVSVEGKNGSGKSTLLKVLGGSLTPKKGTILVDDRKTKYRDFAKRSVSVCPEVEELPDLLTATQYLNLVARLRLVRSLEFISMVAKLLDFNLEGMKPISDYSRGMRQKLCILATLVGNRRMLIFDESFSSVDQQSRKQLLQYFPSIIDKSKTETIVMVNHNPDYEFVGSKLRRIVCENMRLRDVSSSD